MKNVIKTISYIAAAAFAVIAIAMVTTSTAFAAGLFAPSGSLNTGGNAGGSGECAIAMLGNYTTGDGIVTSSSQELCWNKNNLTAEAGDVMNLKIKLKNNGSSAISNAKFKVSGFSQTSNTQSGANFNVTLSGGGVNSESDSVSFDIAGPDQTITYLGYQERYYDNGSQGSAYQSTSTTVFSTGRGIQGGTLDAGDYVYVTLAFEVGEAAVISYNPSVDISGPTSVVSGTPVTLNWSQNNGDADYCSDFTSTPSVSTWNNNNNLNGSETFTLNSTGTYNFSVTCYAPDGTSDTDTHTVTVTSGGGGNAPSVNIYASDQTIDLGDFVNIEWDIDDATSCVFDADPNFAGFNNQSNPNDGFLPNLALSQTTEFEITCSGQNGLTDSDSVTVFVDTNNGGNAPSVSISASDQSIDLGDFVTLEWNIDNATSCMFDADPNYSTFNNQASPNDGSLGFVLLDEDTTFEIVCSGQNGQTDSDSVTVNVSDNGNNEEEPDADTDQPDDVDEDSARLEGSVDMNDFNNGDVFFVYGQNEDDVEDAEEEDEYSDIDTNGQDIRKVRTENNVNGDDDYSERVTGLDANETYYFRICVEYIDEDGDEALECGSVEDFETDNDFQSIPGPGDGGVDQVINPLVVTLPESSLTGTSVIVNAGYNANGCENFSTQFLLGTNTNNMNVSTSIASRGNSSGIMREAVSGLVAGVTYYTRAVGFCNGIPVYGDFESFRTPGRVFPVTPTPVRPVTPTIVTTTLEAGSGLGCLGLEITNNTDGVSRGQTLVYNVRWENVCEQDFEDAVINVQLADELEFLSTTRGTYAGKTEHSVIADLGDIDAEEDGEMMITVRVRPGANLGEVIIVEANLGGDGIGVGVNDTAIEFDFDQVYETGFVGGAASAFLAGFFTSVWGWLLTLLLLAAIILAARFFYVNGRREERRNGYYGYAPAYAQAPAYQQPQYMMHAPQQPMQPAHQAPMYAPAPTAPMAQAPANLPEMNTMNAASQMAQAPDYTVYRPAPFDGSQN